MSRIGKNPITINSTTKVNIEDKGSTYGGQLITVEGPKGRLVVAARPEVKVTVEGEQILVNVEKETKVTKAYRGLYRMLIANAVEGVNNGYTKELEIIGIGYKAEKAGNAVKLHLGFNNPLEYKLPEGIDVDIADGVSIKVKGIDKQVVGEVAAQIRRLRKPEPYKGKGVRYKGEQIKLKQGKSAA